MQMYGVNETGHIMKLNKNHFEYCVNPKRSLHTTAASDTTLGGGKQNSTRHEHWYTLATNEDHVEVWKYSSNFRKSVLFDKAGLITCMDVGKDAIALVYQSPTKLCEVIEISLDGKKTKQITHLNEEALKGKYVAKPEVVQYHSTGMDLKGWYYYQKTLIQRRNIQQY